jgi:hypothetical protein
MIKLLALKNISAEFIDVIHTDSIYFGTGKEIGHVGEL